MRVPIPVAILLSIAVVGGVWWYGSRNADFLTPPSEEKLAQVRAKAEMSLPPADHLNIEPVVALPETPAPPPAPPEEVKPAIDLGDLHSQPGILEYAVQAEKGAAYLAELATALEAKGEFQRALLAWERVLDMGKADETQAHTAIASIKRLRPTLPDWNTDPAKTLAITLQAGTGKKTAKSLQPIIEEVARELGHASAGILKVSAKVTAGRDTRSAAGPAPVALWLTGPAKTSRSTDVLSFTVGKPETLRDEVRQTVFQILRGYLGHKVNQSAITALGPGETALDAFNSHITRNHWLELGTMLNHPPEKTQ